MPRLSASLLLSASLVFAVHAQTPEIEKQAEQLLTSAQRAYNDGNPKAAADQFNEFLTKYAGKKGSHAAKLGLALAILDLPERDYTKAAELLQGPLNEGAFADRPLAIYYTAVCYRGQGLKEAMPAKAMERFGEAARVFGRAAEVFGQRKAEGDDEWVARSLCDKAEMELRINKPKDARASVEPFVKDPAFAASKSRPLGLYYHGFACFQLQDIPAAGKSLGLVAPFDQPWGLHTRYLLGRVHQAGDERAEASTAFDAVIGGYEKQKKDAVEALKQPDRFKNNPWEKARLESLVKDPPPDYVAGASFHAAGLNYEGGKFGEALPKFQAFTKEYATSPLAADAMLRAGYCLVQLKQYDEAAKVLKPLAEKERRLSDQALYWLGKAQFGLAQAVDPNNKPARDQAMKTTLETLKAASDRAGELAEKEKDAAANDRKVEILSEIADVLLASGQPVEAAAAYENAVKVRPTGAKGEEVYQRLVSALQMAGNSTGTAYWAGIFEQKFPQSVLLPEVLFRKAESLHTRAITLAKQKDKAAVEVFEKALAAYKRVIEKYPEYERINRARFGLAVLYADLGEWEKAAETIESIPGPDRTGESAAAAFLLADCLIRTAPAKADDALADNMLREKLGNAITLLDGFLAANPKVPEAPDALLKLAFCHKRIGIQLADPKEKNEAFAKSRAALDRLLKEYAAAPIVGAGLLERARLKLLQGDRNGALEDLKPFTLDARKNDPVAPLAVIAYATLLREQNQAAPAEAVLREARKLYDPILTGDPSKSEWLNLLRFHHGVAMMESGNPMESRSLFESAAASMTGKPLGSEAALMAERALTVDYRKKLTDAMGEVGKAGVNPDVAAARVRSARTVLFEHAKHMEARADSQKTVLTPEIKARLHYEAAWVFRTMLPYLPLNPSGRSLTADSPEAKDPALKELLDYTRAAYRRAIDTNPEAALAVESRFELAELESDTGNAEVALKMLKEALDVEPADRPTSQDLIDRIRFRMGAAEFERKNYDAARPQFEAIAANPKSTLRGQAQYRAAECLFAQGKFEEAKNALKPFRDDPTFHQVDGISDRAMLRLGHAYAGVKNWESSRTSFEAMLGRYGNSPWKAEALYGIGWALLNQNRLDDAVGQFAQVTTLKTDDLAGRAHLQIGLCRSAQKKYGEAVKAFMVVAYGYEAPDLKFAALLEAARALTEDKKIDEAVKLLEKVASEAPADSEWNKAAKERLMQFKKGSGG